MTDATHLFQGTIDGWESWGQVYQSIEAFAPLIHEIGRRHGLETNTIAHLTPGTNAVFLVGDAVFKIYAPAQSGVVPDGAELAGLRHAASVAVPGPRVLASGEIRDRYTFAYVVMAQVLGQEAGDVLPGAPDQVKGSVAAQLRDIVRQLNVPPLAPGIPDTVVENARHNRRWGAFPEEMRARVAAHAQALDPAEFVYVHGDLTGENVLISPQGTVQLIDFGDSHIAPAWYEWPPIVFELFRCDPVLLRAYFGDFEAPEFFHTLTRAVLLHDFGGDFVRNACTEMGVDIATMRDEQAAEALIRQRILHKR